MDRELTLIEHLGELRKRVIISLIALGISAASSVPFASDILKILKAPARGIIDKLAFFGPEEAFLIYLRISLFSALIISMPVILCQVWAFVSPAVEDRLKRYSVYFIIGSSLLFIAGCLFAYFILIPPALKFLLGFATDQLEPVISGQRYISFITGLTLGCGLVFQMPALSFILTKARLINPRMLRKKYKYALVIILVTAAAITPTPDAFNMLLLSAPMLVLYEISIWISWFSLKRAKEPSI